MRSRLWRSSAGSRGSPLALHPPSLSDGLTVCVFWSSPVHRRCLLESTNSRRCGPYWLRLHVGLVGLRHLAISSLRLRDGPAGVKTLFGELREIDD